MIDAILRSYFLEGPDIGDRNVLTELVGSMGLDALDFRDQLASDNLEAEVLAAHRSAVSRGALSVSSYRLNGVHIEKTVDLIANCTGPR